MKNWRYLALKDEEVMAIAEFAKKEQVSFDIAIHWLLEGGLRYYAQRAKQSLLPVKGE